MSGEMCTSLGNGFSNLMFMLYTCERKGCTDVEGVVEGDDGLFTMTGTPPTIEDFAELGLVIKLDRHTKLSTASFCGIVFDEDDKANITDPREVLASFGWGSKEYARSRPFKKMALLRCKALSYAYQYPGCPIIGDLAFSTLCLTDRAHREKQFIDESGFGRATKKIIDRMNPWEREQLLEALAQNSKRSLRYVPPRPGSRQLVEELYGIPLDHQLKIEASLWSSTQLEPLTCPYIGMHMSPDWNHYFDNYAFVSSRQDPDLERPTRVWPHPPAEPEWF
jgi:hypothetical protein